MSPTLQMEPESRLSSHQQQAIQMASEAALAASSHLLNEPIFCTFDNGTLVLQGRVRSFYKKQIAQTIVADIAGVTHIVNQIEVGDSH